MMEWLSSALDFFLHIDKHLAEAVQAYGVWTYAILIAIVFCETGLVVTPFLPGDSLLFAAGALSALGALEFNWLFIGLVLAAVVGDSTNYWIGRYIGPRAFSGNYRLLRRDYLERTQAFYARHGGKTVFLARFVPIIRTFAPFVAGVSAMPYATFVTYSVTGSIAWVGGCAGAGYVFGNIPVVKDNFSLVVLGIIGVSLMPVVITALRERGRRAA
jgi:membrane-associated protein